MVPDGFSQVAPGCYLSASEDEIRFRESRYFKACNEVVLNHPHGGVTRCIIRAGHNGDRHQDEFGHSTGGQQTIEGL